MIKSLLICLLFLTSCGNGGSERVYKIGYESSFYGSPLNGQTKNAIAFSEELLYLIGQKKNIKLSLVERNADVLIDGLKNKEYDAILSAQQPYPFLEKIYVFSTPYLLTGPVLVVPADSKISALRQLNGKQLGVLVNSTAEVVVQQNPVITILTFLSYPQALNAIVAQTIDGAVLPSLIAHAYVRDLYHDSLRVATAPLNNEGLRLIGLQNDLIDQFNEGLHDLQKNGTYEKLLRKYEL